MQECGFGLIATDLRREAFKIASMNGNNSFSSEKCLAGWDWWIAFKKRYGLVMREPENLSMSRASASTKENINNFYDTLQLGFERTGLADKPERIWNLDEGGFSFVTKSQKTVSPKEAERVFQPTPAEKGETTTVLLTINAAGDGGPSLIIFKGIRLSDEM